MLADGRGVAGSSSLDPKLVVANRDKNLVLRLLGYEITALWIGPIPEACRL